MRGIMQVFGGMLMIEGFAFIIFSTQWNITAAVALALGLFLFLVNPRFMYLGEVVVRKEIDQMVPSTRKGWRNLIALLFGWFTFMGVWAVIAMLAFLGIYPIDPAMAGYTSLVAVIFSLVIPVVTAVGILELVEQWE